MKIGVRSAEARRAPAAPYGGRLVDLVATADQRAALLEEARTLESLQLSAESVAWLSLLARGALSPLDRFLGQADAESVRSSMRLANGMLFPAPIVLPLRKPAPWELDTRLALRDARNHLLALLTVEEIFPWHGMESDTPSFAVSGPMQVLSPPESLLFPQLRRTPADVRQMLAHFGGAQILAADAWDVDNESQAPTLKNMAEKLDASLLLNLAAAEYRVDDYDLHLQLRRWKERFPAAFGKQAVLNVLDLPEAVHGERNVLLRAILHRNYGAHIYLCSSQDLSESLRIEDRTSHGASLMESIRAIGLEPIAIQAQRLFPVTASRKHSSPPTGLCIWFTGLPGAGKSTIAEQLTVRLMEHGRRVTLLDGDVVRTHLSRGLSFSREDRETNVQRIGFVASEIVRHGGVAVCAAVSPYRSARESVRRMMPPGAFVEVFVDTPLSVCEQRDVKGFYARARSGQMKSFTGVDDPYEAPENPEIRITTSDTDPQQETQQIFDFLLQGYLGTEPK